MTAEKTDTTQENLIRSVPKKLYPSAIYILPLFLFAEYLLFNNLYHTSITDCGFYLPFIITASIICIIILFLFVVSFIGAVHNIKLNSSNKLPPVLAIISIIIIIGYSLYMSIIGSHSFAESLRVFSISLFFTSLSLTPLYCFTSFSDSEMRHKTAVKIISICFGAWGLFMTWFYYGVFSSARIYDTAVSMINEFWYYRPEPLMIGFSVWVILGLIISIMSFRKK